MMGLLGSDTLLEGFYSLGFVGTTVFFTNFTFYLIQSLQDSLGISYHVPQFSSPPVLPSPLLYPHKRFLKLNQIKTKQVNKQKERKKKTNNLFLSPSFLSLQHLFILGGIGSYGQSHFFVQLSLLANVHCNDALVLFSACGFWYHHHWILTQTPFRYPVSTRVIQTTWIPQDLSLHELQQVLDGVDIRVGQHQVQLLAWVVDVLLILGYWGCPLRQGSEPVLLCPCHLGQFSLTSGKKQGHLFRDNVEGMGAVLLQGSGQLSCCSVQLSQGQ